MSRKKRRAKQTPADREIDFHGATAAQMRAELDLRWARREWHGLRNVRVIHGTGEVLWRELHRWCREKGVEFTLEAHQGATLLHPGQRLLANASPFHRPLAPLKQQLRALQPKQGDDSHRNGHAPVEDTACSNPVDRGAVHRVQGVMNGASTEARGVPEAPNPESPDLMAEEFASLAGEDPQSLRDRKHSLDLPPSDRPASGTPAAASAPQMPASRKTGDEELLAREFERLGREDGRTLRRRKGFT